MRYDYNVYRELDYYELWTMNESEALDAWRNNAGCSLCRYELRSCPSYGASDVRTIASRWQRWNGVSWGPWEA